MFDDQIEEEINTLNIGYNFETLFEDKVMDSFLLMKQTISYSTNEKVQS